MNLIHCQKDCVYQSDGYCGLDRAAAVTCSQLNQCSFYQNKMPASSIRPDVPLEHPGTPNYTPASSIDPTHDGAQYLQGTDEIQ